MELAQALLALWQRKLLVAIGVLVAALAGVASVQLLKSTVYAAATTQMVVDSPRSALGNIDSSLDPFTARAGVFAQLMTTPQALDSIGQAAGIPSNEIAAQGPSSPTATVTQPTTPQGAGPSATRFKLLLTQDPALPTIDVYAEAPTTQQAAALANGAVSGFTKYLRAIEAQGAIPAAQQVQIRQLGSAIGGVVDPSSSKKIAVLIAVIVFLAWCAAILLGAKWRRAWATGPAIAPNVGGQLAPNRTVRLPLFGAEGNHLSEPDRIAATVEWHSPRDEV